MKKLTLLCILVFCSNCKKRSEEFIIAFGSCNKQYKTNILWPEIAKNDPKVWIWGGDNIYSDIDSMAKLKTNYQNSQRTKSI